MIGDLFSKLQEARQMIEESKKKLNDIIVEASVENGAIKVKANANKAIISIEIAEHLIQAGNKSQLEEMIAVATNRALEEAAMKGEIEMKKITKDMLPNFPGLV
jgi:nucleoid-associated protein EbfC